MNLTLSERAQRTLDAYRQALPGNEFEAVGAWLSTFYRYQLEWLLDPSRFALLNKSRQIGASHVYAAQSVLWGMLGDTTTIVSVGEREALEVLDKAARHAEVLARLGSDWARPTPSAKSLRLGRNGGRVLALPSTSGGRSYSGNVILDEVAYYQHPAQVWDGAGGTVLHGYRLRAASTPNGVGNFWHALWTDPAQHAGYTRHQVALDEARADGLPVDDAECWRMARGDPRVYDQLFRCSFVDNEQQYLPTQAIEACSVADTYCPDGVCYAGLDVGRTSDRTELVIVRVDPQGVRWLQHAESRSRTSLDDIDALAASAFAHPWRCKRLAVDATGMGAFPAEQLQRRHGRTRVEAVTFTLATKEDLATGLYEAFTSTGPNDSDGEPTRGTIRIPRADTMLRDELCSLRRIVTSAGNVRYDAPHTDKGHADRAWALALALHAGASPDRRRHVIAPTSNDHAL